MASFCYILNPVKKCLYKSIRFFTRENSFYQIKPWLCIIKSLTQFWKKLERACSRCLIWKKLFTSALLYIYILKLKQQLASTHCSVLGQCIQFTFNYISYSYVNSVSQSADPIQRNNRLSVLKLSRVMCEKIKKPIFTVF